MVRKHAVPLNFNILLGWGQKFFFLPMYIQIIYNTVHKSLQNYELNISLVYICSVSYTNLPDPAGGTVSQGAQKGIAAEERRS